MATSTVVPLEEYLRTNYEHDPDWVNGELRERGMPDEYHAYFQTRLATYFNTRVEELGLRAMTELRMKVNALNYRLPDVTVIPARARFLPKFLGVPVVCIEVVSPDERIGELREKIGDFLSAGVETVWVVDPRKRTMTVADAQGSRVVTAFDIPGTDARLTGAELFAEMDELEA